MFSKDMIDKMSKAEVKAAKNLDAFLSDDDRTMLDARWAALTAPPAPTAFPKQAELDEAYAQWKAWGETIKALHTEARLGNHTYHKADGETVKPGKTRKAPVKAGKATIVIGGTEYKSWTEAANGLNVHPEYDHSVARNWRPLVMAATEGTVRLTGTTVEEYAQAFPIPKDCKWAYVAAEEVKAE